MKFNFDNLVLWLKNGKTRTLTFYPNKINIITGDSNTGKTAILDIIDYCLFASSHKISESMINENIKWYGIRFSVNEKCYTIARKSPSGNIVSADYYFSSIGEIPEQFPEQNITASALKTSLESDFKIDRGTKVSYGGKVVKANSKISLRYFLLFNTISQDIVTHSEEFFDKQKDPRYREALPRTFDLAVGIDTAENILKREKREEIEQEIRRLKREEEKLTRNQEAFYSQLAKTVKTAKEFSVIPESVEIDEAVQQLKTVIAQEGVQMEMNISEKYDSINKEISILIRKIRNLERFSREYKNYKANLNETGDSLKPIEYITENYADIIKTSIYDDVISRLKEDYTKIKQAIVSKTPLDSNVSDIIKGYEERLKELQEQKDLLPAEIRAFESDKKKYMFLGETKAKLALYERDHSVMDDSRNTRIDSLENDLRILDVDPVESRRALFIEVLDETIQEYIGKTKTALENYGDYRASFNYKEKKLQLRKPKTDLVENVGSSSNHMFLHLFLFLGLHELIINRDIPYVPPFLIIDQFSRPYWGEGDRKKESLDHTDISKVTSALNLLNSFVDDINDIGKEFQMIIFEHINHELWENLDNIQLVEEFRNGNALVPEAMLSE